MTETGSKLKLEKILKLNGRQDDMKIKGSAFLEHPIMDECIEAAYKIVMELQERRILKVKIKRKEGEESFIQWESDTDSIEQS